ncbi:2Fe-2S iron-sulfur cluster-binding protein [Streptomyces sp. NBC_01216]|uniref:2Fe-2S iron-sulfur cluster-binding protein n=1 Tax=Streptomyces sp. NPDC048577 TaxID=3157209 RepID=UPI002E0E3B21|nr:2Fe-2S iron-sulfur cluster-binding protein [Streptomyces sp. NBC_01216]
MPQSEGYDGDATAFVQLPPDFMLDGVPLEAPGHGYVPPMITPLTPLHPAPSAPSEQDPRATGQWNFTEAVGAGAPGETDSRPLPGAPSEQDPRATGQWNFTEAVEAASPSTGQWRIPVAEDGSDESGEYTTSMLAQYAGGDAASPPGGAPEPWAPAETAEPHATTDPAVDPAARGAEQGSGPAPDAEPADAPDARNDSDDAFPEEAGAHEAGADGTGAPGAPASTAHAEPPHPDAPLEDAPAAGVVAYGSPPDESPVALPVSSSADSDEHPHTSYVLRVNGADRPVTDSWIGESLLYVLRERLGLAGAKDGCSQGECGACNVQVDGRLVASCLVPAATAAGSEVRTVEGLAHDGRPSDVQRALARCGAVQCGFCVPGMAMTVHDLLEGNHAPTELEARQALCGNLCRCSGYRGVLGAVREVVAEREATAAAESADDAHIPHQIPHPHDGGTA